MLINYSKTALYLSSNYSVAHYFQLVFSQERRWLCHIHSNLGIESIAQQIEAATKAEWKPLAPRYASSSWPRPHGGRFTASRVTTIKRRFCRVWPSWMLPTPLTLTHTIRANNEVNGDNSERVRLRTRTGLFGLSGLYRPPDIDDDMSNTPSISYFCVTHLGFL